MHQGTVALAPTVDDARVAAEALAEMGAGRVLLWGSVQRGEATPRSDIDLIAVFDDLGDYECRRDTQRRLEDRAADATGHPVDVFVTDRPEWEWRTTRCRASFEWGIKPFVRELVDRAPRVEIDWAKEIGLTDNDEAITSERLGNLANALGMATVQFPLPPVDDRRRLPLLRMASANCQVAIEQGVKAVLYGVGEQPPENIHDLAKLLAGVAGPQRERLAAALGDISLEDVTLWNLAWRYMRQMKPGVAERLTAPEFTAALFRATLRLSQAVAEIFAEQEPDRDLSELVEAVAAYERAVETGLA